MNCEPMVKSKVMLKGNMMEANVYVKLLTYHTNFSSVAITVLHLVQVRSVSLP